MGSRLLTLDSLLIKQEIHQQSEPKGKYPISHILVLNLIKISIKSDLNEY